MSDRTETVINERELARLRGIEEAARWHLAHSACAGWEQGEVLALALGIDPEGPRKQFWELLDALGVHHDEDPFADLLASSSTPPADPEEQ